MFTHTPFDKLLLKSPTSLKTDKKSTTNILLTPKPNQGSTPYRSSTSVKHKSLQSKTQNTPNNKKILAISSKRIVNSILGKAFQLIQYRVRIKAISFKLLQTKQKRNLQSAFSHIRIITQYQRQNTLLKLHQIKRNPQLIVSVIKKAQFNFRVLSFQKIKKRFLRKRRLQTLTNMLNNCLQAFLRQSIYKMFWSKFNQFNAVKKHQLVVLNSVLILDKKRLYRIKLETFQKIINFGIYSGYELQFSLRKNKNRQIVQLSSSRRKEVTQQKEKLKKLKMTYDQLNLQKNRSKNDLKRSRNNVQMQFSSEIKHLTKQIQQKQNQIQETMEIHNQKKRLLTLRQKRRANSLDAQTKVKNIFKNIQTQNNTQIKNIRMVISSFDSQMNKFKQENDFFFWQNLKLNEQVYIYQKIKKAEEGLECFEKIKEENQYLKSMTSLIAMRQVDKAVNSSILKQSTTSTQTPRQEVNSLPRTSRTQSNKVRDQRHYINKF